MDPRAHQQAVQKAEAGRESGDIALVNRVYEELDRINTVKRLNREERGRRFAEGTRQFDENLAFGKKKFADTMGFKRDRLKDAVASSLLSRSDMLTQRRRAKPVAYAGLGLSGATAYTDYLAGKKEAARTQEITDLLKSYLKRPVKAGNNYLINLTGQGGDYGL